MTNERNPIRTSIAIRMADEGIPFRAIQRVLQMEEEDLRDDIDLALYRGVLTAAPPHDWPRDSTRLNRRPIAQPLISYEERCLYIANALGLSGQQSRLMEQLLRHATVTKGLMYAALATEGDPKIVDVQICKMRERLRKPHPSIIINTIWGVGYSLASESAAYINKLIKDTYEIPLAGEDNAQISRHA